MTRVTAFGAAALVLLTLFGAASKVATAHDDAAIGDLRIVGPWARATIGKGRSGAAYMTIINKGTADDDLVAVESPVAKRAMVHRTQLSHGVMRMRPVPVLSAPAGKKTVLKPGGYHVMLMGLSAPLKKGATFPLTLTFEKAGSVTVEVTVMAPAAMKGMPAH